MNLSNVHFEQELERSDVEHDLAVQIAPILKKEFERFFLLGMAEGIGTTTVSLQTLQANVSNEALSDAAFRRLAGSMIKVMLE